MKLSEALLCSIALAAVGTATHGTVEAVAVHALPQDTAAKSPDRKMRADTASRGTAPPVAWVRKFVPASA